MRKTREQIIAEIDAHLQKSDKKYWSDYYIGITNDINRRLFTEHNVNRDNAWWIWREATSKSVAQAVEEHYLALGMKGDTGGGTDDSVFVYCYEVTSTTIE